MPKFPKPEEGSWTEHYPGLGTAPVSYKDSYDPDFWQQEIDTIFKKEWLNVGRVEQLPRIGSYFTKEFAWAKRSIIIVKDKDGTVRAFHNVCRHRGNKLVWDDYPQEETSGSCRQFTCKYHAWRYDLDGSLNFVQQESEFFDLDKENLGLIPVACDVWEGFIFVNLDDEPAQTLTEALHPFSEGLAGYPFGEMTQVYRAKSEVKANWKLFIDAFIEFYHAPILHMKQATAEEAQKLASYGFEALHYDIFSPHSRRVVVGRHGSAEGSEHRQAVGERDAQRPVRPVGQARRDQQQREPAAARQPGPPQGLGHRHVHGVAEHDDPDLGAGLVPHVPLLARPARASTSSRPPSTSCRRRTPATASPRRWRCRRSRSTRSRTPTPSRPPSR